MFIRLLNRGARRGGWDDLCDIRALKVEIGQNACDTRPRGVEAVKSQARQRVSLFGLPLPQAAAVCEGHAVGCDVSDDASVNASVPAPDNALLPDCRV